MTDKTSVDPQIEHFIQTETQKQRFQVILITLLSLWFKLYNKYFIFKELNVYSVIAVLIKIHF